MKITKPQLKQIIKEELEILSEKYIPYTTGDLQRLLKHIAAADYSVQILFNGQPLEIDEVWENAEEKTLNITVR